MLGGVDWRVRKGDRREGREDEEEEISREEMRKVIKNLREEKAVGGMAYQMKCGNMGGVRWRNGYGKYAIRYGGGRDGRRSGGRE